jgi:hypothetical protein
LQKALRLLLPMRLFLGRNPVQSLMGFVLMFIFVGISSSEDFLFFF